MNTLLLLVILEAATSQIAVEGETDCPAPSTLQQLLAAEYPDAARPSHRVRLAARASSLEVALFNEAGQLVATRQLTREGTCNELADAAAAIVAAWELSLPELQVPQLQVEAPPISVEERWRLSGMAGMSAAWSVRGIALGVLLSASASAPGSRWSIRLTADWQPPRSAPLESGRVNWSRLGVGVGPGVTLFKSPSARMDLAVQAFISQLSLWGSENPINESHQIWEPRGGMTLRGAWRAGAVQPFAALIVNGWPVDQQARYEGGGRLALPRFDLGVALGVCMGEP
ncbi:MAG: hypothetical protein ACT4TC_25320 [Myxococcaceae bacterium]